LKNFWPNERGTPSDVADAILVTENAMAEIVLFPLHHRQKLVRQLRRAQTTNEVRYALRRTATTLERIGIAPAVIDAQIRAVSLVARHQMWRYQPGGDVA
jgi:hypothetical protein